MNGRCVYSWSCIDFGALLFPGDAQIWTHFDTLLGSEATLMFFLYAQPSQTTLPKLTSDALYLMKQDTHHHHSSNQSLSLDYQVPPQDISRKPRSRTLECAQS